VAMPQHDQDADVDAGVAAAIATQFGGDAVLYHAYAATCTVQFVVDRAAGRAACVAGDLSALRLLAHNLKSALGLRSGAGPLESRCSLGTRVGSQACLRRIRMMTVRQACVVPV